MAENYTLKIDAGTDKMLRLRFKDADGNYEDLTNHSARMMLKLKYDSETALLEYTSAEGEGITFELYDEDSTYIDTLCVHFTNLDTDTLVDYTLLDSDGDVELGTGVYDLEKTDEESLVSRSIPGYWIAFPAVTKE